MSTFAWWCAVVVCGGKVIGMAHALFVGDDTPEKRIGSAIVCGIAALGVASLIGWVR
jgi:hypothetical protein